VTGPDRDRGTEVLPAGTPGRPGDGPSGAVVPGAVWRAVARHPALWWTALGTLFRLAAPGWWRRRPYLPWPDQRLWAFRMVTAYGRPDAVPTGGDVVSYLEWCRGERRGRVGPPPAGAP